MLVAGVSASQRMDGRRWKNDIEWAGVTAVQSIDITVVTSIASRIEGRLETDRQTDRQTKGDAPQFNAKRCT